ncbi:MAG TPA: PEP-CTERM sorting domain-containing protein [Burkholderiales bacterium]|nr:PEP-CTERM sorting domain-containing protein [Burkholderiales bacterium]
MSHASWKRIAASIAIAVSAVFATGAEAALLAYDPFGTGPGQYAAGDDSTGTNVLGGQNPAIGPTPFYAGGWIQSGGDAQAVKNGSLSYPLFPNSGGHVSDSLQFSCCSFGRDGREINGGLGGGRTDRTLYQSFLINFGSQGTDDPTQFGLRGYEMWNGGVGDSFKAVDVFMNHFSGVNELTLRVETPSGTQTDLVGSGLTLDELEGTHLLVLRFDFSAGGSDFVTLYMDPTDSIEGNYVPVATIEVPNSDLFITHHGTISNFTFSGGGHDPGEFDEVRWGDTFADVTPFLTGEVPVPATLALIPIGLLGIAIARRRRC